VPGLEPQAGLPLERREANSSIRRPVGTLAYFARDVADHEELMLVDRDENTEVLWATSNEAAELLKPTGEIRQPVHRYLKEAIAATR
jgi:hypothetical protein